MRSRFLSLGLVQKEVMINKWDKIEAFIQMPRGQEKKPLMTHDPKDNLILKSVLPILSGQAKWKWSQYTYDLGQDSEDQRCRLTSCFSC